MFPISCFEPFPECFEMVEMLFQVGWKTSSLFFDRLGRPVPGRRLFALPAVRAFPGLRVEIFQTGKSRCRWICSGSKELIAFCAANIVSSVDATKNGAYRKDIRGGRLLERTQEETKKHRLGRCLLLRPLRISLFSCRRVFGKFRDVHSG